MRLTSEQVPDADQRRYVFTIDGGEMAEVVGDDALYAGNIDLAPISRQLRWPISRQLRWLSRIAEDLEHLEARKRHEASL